MDKDKNTDEYWIRYNRRGIVNEGPKIKNGIINIQDLNHHAIARDLGLQRVYVSKLLCGEISGASYVRVYKIAKLLKVSTDDFIKALMLQRARWLKQQEAKKEAALDV